MDSFTKVIARLIGAVLGANVLIAIAGKHFNDVTTEAQIGLVVVAAMLGAALASVIMHGLE